MEKNKYYKDAITRTYIALIIIACIVIIPAIILLLLTIFSLSAGGKLYSSPTVAVSAIIFFLIIFFTVILTNYNRKIGITPEGLVVIPYSKAESKCTHNTYYLFKPNRAGKYRRDLPLYSFIFEIKNIKNIRLVTEDKEKEELKSEIFSIQTMDLLIDKNNKIHEFTEVFEEKYIEKAQAKNINKAVCIEFTKPLKERDMWNKKIENGKTIRRIYVSVSKPEELVNYIKSLI